MTQRWEYLTAAIPADPGEALRQLNELGAAGWELAHVAHPSTEKNRFVHPCWFKRHAIAGEQQ